MVAGQSLLSAVPDRVNLGKNPVHPVLPACVIAKAQDSYSGYSRSTT